MVAAHVGLLENPNNFNDDFLSEAHWMTVVRSSTDHRAITSLDRSSIGRQSCDRRLSYAKSADNYPNIGRCSVDHRSSIVQASADAIYMNHVMVWREHRHKISRDIHHLN